MIRLSHLQRPLVLQGDWVVLAIQSVIDREPAFYACHVTSVAAKTFVTDTSPVRGRRPLDEVVAVFPTRLDAEAALENLNRILASARNERKMADLAATKALVLAIDRLWGVKR